MKNKIRYYFVILAVFSLLFGFLLGPQQAEHDLKVVMREAVTHEMDKVSIFGIETNPSVLSAFTVSGFLIVAAILIRLIFIPKFQIVPGRMQMILEQLVMTFKKLAKDNSPQFTKILEPYIFTAGIYVAVSTLF